MLHVVIALVVLALTTQIDPQALQHMAASERAFAAAAEEIGVRDAFLTFFADDAIELRAGPTGRETLVVPAKPEIRSRPLAALPLAGRLIWAPFTGQVSSDGTLGWLTGGYVNMTTSRRITAQGAYFSVWTRQADGTWKVWLDQGVTLPSVWTDAAPFRVAADPDAGAVGAPDETLDAAERAVANGGDPWRARLAGAIRYHRDRQAPIVGKDAVVEWASRAWTSVSTTVATTQLAGSNDLGVAMGGYDAERGAAAGREHGLWLRVWKRDIGGRWRIVFESTRASQ